MTSIYDEGIAEQSREDADLWLGADWIDPPDDDEGEGES